MRWMSRTPASGQQEPGLRESALHDGNVGLDLTSAEDDVRSAGRAGECRLLAEHGLVGRHVHEAVLAQPASPAQHVVEQLARASREDTPGPARDSHVDGRVARRAVGGQQGLALEERHGGGATPGQVVRRRQAPDTAADDHDAITHIPILPEQPADQSARARSARADVEAPCVIYCAHLP